MGLDFEDIDIEKDRELGYKERGIRPRELNTTPRYYLRLRILESIKFLFQREFMW